MAFQYSLCSFIKRIPNFSPCLSLPMMLWLSDFTSKYSIRGALALMFGGFPTASTPLTGHSEWLLKWCNTCCFSWHFTKQRFHIIIFQVNPVTQCAKHGFQCLTNAMIILTVPINKGVCLPPLKNLYNIPRILGWGLYSVGFLLEACLVSESAAVLGAIRADKMCLLQSFYLHPPTVREPLSHLSF